MLNAFAAKRMTDNTFFTRFELMRERFIGLCEAYIKNAAKNSAFSCSFIYYFSTNDEIAKCVKTIFGTRTYKTLCGMLAMM